MKQDHSRNHTAFSAVGSRALLDGYKELTPVLYGKDVIKHLFHHETLGNQLLFHTHWHDRMEILYVKSGSMELTLGEEQVTLLSEQAAVISPQSLHCGYSGVNGTSYHTIMFDTEKLCNDTNVSEKYLKPIIRCENNFDMVVSNPDVIHQISRLTHYFTSQEAQHPLLAMGIVYEILGLLYLDLPQQAEHPIRPDRKFSEVFEYIHHHFCENLSAKSLSSYFNYNETYFCRHFKELTGLTVMKYIQILRMEKAQSLLEKTTDEIGLIARKCGFSDTCYFSNCFKKQSGYTPTHFRRLHTME